ncbi:hypothetical protein PP460_gp089 [Streptomyces phage Muntaha]|uniref:Uncharacterized protein n=1 Tax=Streptomyces phage Muntaha TaxID=2713269 RepID=A0A6G8R3G2_9CAUD|nr:hypothetical protein PP460_gp089 [Streptomyces phage Muntaha]QIN94713.1 hypothetical protein SEA_MUNTAHA_189 [Streptomyces phage Muntaha]
MSMPIQHQAALAIVLAQYEKMLLEAEDGKTFDKADLGFRVESLHKVQALLSTEAYMLAAIGLGAIAAAKGKDV